MTKREMLRLRRELHLKPHDYIVAAYAEPCSGPGWRNSPIWVVVQDGDKNLRMECIQPKFQTAQMMDLYRISAIIHSEMTGAVSRATDEKTYQLCR